MDTIFTLLGCLFAGIIVSLIIFAIIGSRNYENNFNKSLLVSTIIIGIVLFGLDYIYQSKISKIETLETEVEQQKEEPQKDFTYLNELINKDIPDIYNTFNIEEKRKFWLKIIDKIYIKEGKIKEVTFL